jgi:eukaryotic-like serine/threonine-protein kinase
VNGEWERGEPRVVGGYELVSLLGKGGMAKVHLARKVGEDGYVAVKAVRADDLDDETGTVTLHDEARLLSHIRHPNVVPLLDVLRAEDQILLVMPFVRGASLAELMVGHSRAQTMIPAGVASAIVQDTLAGLGAAHVARGAQGEPLHVVHRDVSPQNAIVADDGVTAVLDFGIAKAVGRSAKTTRDGAMKGKVAYMAPEQVHGEDIDARADLYAVGVVLWEMLALDRLFAGANDADTLRRVLMAQVPSLSTFRSDLPPNIDAFFTKALARGKGARFTSAEQMATALQRLIPRALPVEVARSLEVCAAEIARRDPPRSHRTHSIAPVVSIPPANTPGGGVRGREGRSPWPAIFGLVSILTFGVLGVFVMTRHTSTKDAAAASTTASSATVVVEEAAVESPAPELPYTPTLPSSATPATPAVSAVPKKQVSHTLPANCAVAYTVDEHGRKKYRTECLP